MSANVLEVSDSNFQSEVLDSTTPVVVDFWAPWCKPCLALAPMMEELAADNTGAIKFVKLNVEENQKTGMTYRVQAIPTLLFFKGGQRAGEVIGNSLRKEELQKRIDELKA